MNAATQLLREDLRDFAGYRSARSEVLQGDVWLNANEASRANPADTDGSLRRYPDPQPPALRDALAGMYGCSTDELLIGRGSDEAIDLLVRALCRPGSDAVLVTPPVFGMYAVSARLQGARVVEVPLRDDKDDFRVDLGRIAIDARRQQAKVVFLCSPGNPAGGLLPAAAVIDLARTLAGQALVVVDEAYIEFADAPSLAPLVGSWANLAVLRTLSKAHALAGARIGSLVANAELISILRRLQAPYPIPGPSSRLALQALSAGARAATAANVRKACIERELLRASLQAQPCVSRVYPSRANFLLARFVDAEAAWRRLHDASVIVRDMRSLPQLGDALRISVGSEAQNRRVVDALGST